MNWLIAGSVVFAKENFSKGDFLLEIKGNLVSEEMGATLKKKYEEEGVESYLYFFRLEGTVHW